MGSVGDEEAGVAARHRVQGDLDCVVIVAADGDGMWRQLGSSSQLAVVENDEAGRRADGAVGLVVQMGRGLQAHGFMVRRSLHLRALRGFA